MRTMWRGCWGVEMRRYFCLSIGLILLNACGSLMPQQPEMSEIYDLRQIRYRDENGNGLIPVARSAGETRSRLWQRWLQTYQNQWQNQPHFKPSGYTQWCVQWQNAHDKMERICRRETALIWFERGVLQDKIAIQMADKIWALKF